MRPQPGQAETCGVNERRPSDWSTCWATSTSSVRSPPGAGVSETRIVSPMPSVSRIDRPGRRGDDALHAHARLGQAEVERVVAARGKRRGRRRRGPARRETLALMMIRSCARPVSSASSAERSADCEHRLDHHVARVGRRRPDARSRPSARSAAAWSSEPQLTPMRTGLPLLDRDPDDGRKFSS